MREIKFRAWDKQTEKMVNRDYTITPNGESLLEGHDGFDNQYPSYILMQFTGLKDKNGVEIYEGDIVRARTENTFLNWEVSYCEDICEFGLFRKNYEHHCRFIDVNHKSNEIEVIGNIYQNPELIK